MKNFRFLVISLALLAFIVFLFAGIYLGFQFNMPQKEPRGESISYPENPSRNPTLRQFLVIQVDSLASESPQAQSIFHVSLQASTQDISVIPLAMSDDENHTLISVFSVLDDGSISPVFFAEIEKRRISFDHYILLDQFAAEKSLEWLYENRLTGMADSPKDPDDDLWPVAEPEKLIASIKQSCEVASQLPLDTNWMNLFLMLIPKHMRTDYPIDTMIVDWKYLNQTQAPFTCEIMEP